jgi:hypothetical protein
MVAQVPNGKQQFFDTNGNPLAGGSVTFYIPSTTTPKDTYTDSTGATPNANPLTLDGAGEAVIWGTGSYRQVLKDSLGNTIWDQVVAVPITTPITGGLTITSGGFVVTAGGASITGGLTTDSLVTSSINAGPLAGLRNRFVNPLMSKDQRNGGVAQTITAGAALAYTVDQWYAFCTGANVTGQQILSSTANSRYRYRFTGAASVTLIAFVQRIEANNCFDMAGKSATLSVEISNSLLPSVNYAVYYANTANTFGTVAAPTRTLITNGTFSVNSTMTRYNVTFSVPSAATTGIEVVFAVGAQISGTWETGACQLEIGTIATQLEARSTQGEQVLCDTYYEIGTVAMGGYNAAGGGSYNDTQFRSRKFTTPTMSANITVNTNCTFTAVTPDGPDSYRVVATITALGLFALGGTWTATAVIP